MDFQRIQDAVAATGLMCRGGFHPHPDDGVPGEPGTLVIVGNAGPDMWQAFSAGRWEETAPMNGWTSRVLGRVAADVGASVLFPFDGPPYLPFQRWAQRADAVFPSPLGPFVHPDFGLWHAYRGALAFTEELTLPSRDERPSPCDSCDDRPCLTTCPVQAFEIGRYDVPACARHIASPAGADCMDHGCRARRACPIGQDYAYATAQARFHMDHFLDAHGPG